MVFPGTIPKTAVILDFRPRLGNHCMIFPGTIPKTASILDFRLKLANRCSTIVAAAKNSPSAAPSWGAGGDRMPRRRHNPKLKAAGVAPVPAATTMSVSDSNFRSGNEEWPARHSDQRKRP